VCALALVGCGYEAGEAGEETREAGGAIVEHNALSANALAWNGIALNGIALNGIALNALDAATLDPQNLDAITAPGPTGDLARQFVRYAVSCAFSPTQTFSFSYVDALGALHQEAYPGTLAIAPEWATGPIGDERQRLLTACLAARVNYYEVPVVISVRSWLAPLQTLSSDAEVAAYSNVEGAFWGNLFAADPYIVACYNSETVDNSRAYQRDCAAGHLDASGATLDCGPIQIVGPCSSYCMSLNGGGKYYPSCRERPGQSNAMTKAVVTTALP